MASPESNKPAPKSPPVQDSPIFGYVSSLSPIKPVNARSTVQVYENIDVPSPQLVFKTPNFIRPRYSSLSERSQHLASSGTENLSPGYVNNTREFSDNMITGASMSLSTVQLISYSDKECANVDPSPNHSCTSPTNCVDAFLADPSENSENFSSSPEFCVKRVAKDKEDDKSGHSENQMEGLKEDLQVHPRSSSIPVKEQTNDRLHSKGDAFPPHTSQNDSICIQESTVELHDANMKEHTRTAVMSLIAPYQTEEDPGSVSLAAEAMGINEGTITGQLGQVSKNENDSVYERVMDRSIVSSVKDFDISHNEKENHTTSDFLCHHKQDLKQQTVKTDQSDEFDCTPNLHPGSPQNIQTDDNFIDNSLQMHSVSTGNHISFDPEDDAHCKRGKRKRLQFEAGENLRISNRSSFNCATEASNADLSITLLGVETANASHTESITKSSHKQVDKSVPASVSSEFSVKFDQSRRCKENLVAAPRPAGIGLHLNSIGGAASINCNSSMQLERNSSVQEDKTFAEDIDQLSEKSKNCPASVSLIDPAKLTFSSDKPLKYVVNENNVEKQLGNQAFQQHSSGSYQSPLSVKPLKSVAPLKHMDRYMTPCTMKMPSSEEVNKSEESTQTSPKKKKKKTLENDGQKRCNCKRSKCLKLYCDCFAAGSFCSETCACQDCSNKVECEEIVRETRQQIESRNPLAFAPKVVLRVSDPPKASGDNKTITPASARHKRGCNCKKSLCLKKYCECFQAGVGCSLGCRCEGCKNTFGAKDGCEISEVVVEHKRPKEGGWERDLSGELECIEVNRQITITEQCRYRLSPLTPLHQSLMGNDATNPQFPASYFPSPESVASAVRSYDPSGVDLNAMQNSGLVEDRTGSSSLVFYDPKSEFHNAGKGDPFSPGWEGFPDMCNLSPLLKASPNAGGSSSASKSGERKIVKLHRGSNRIALGALHWRSSPITPLPEFGEGKLPREPDSDSTLQCNLEDDTPEILKETRSPIKSVTATSPNQKRVSPPHHAGTSANSSSSLRSGRRYILRSMPTFPPLTPYSKINSENET